MNPKPLYIFDVDGTLACCKHRRHFVERERGEQDWKRFYSACDKDSPITPVIATMERLRHAGADIWFFSGRSDEVKDKTVAWLAQYTSFMTHELEGPMLTMRSAGDYTPDDELKRGWFEEMMLDDKRRLVAVFDDRSRVVRMWRGLKWGVMCFQVADGEF